MAKNSSSRNDRNNPYLVEGWAVDFHRSKAGIAWRWRTELALLIATVAGYVRLAAAITALWAGITLAALITAALLVPYSRRFTVQPGAWSPGTGCSGSVTRPGCTPGPGGSR